MVKTRDLFKKIRDTKGTFDANMGTIKERNGVDLTEAQDIKKRRQEYTEELYKKDLHDHKTRILSPPLALFVLMFPKAHLTSHSRMSGSM